MLLSYRHGFLFVHIAKTGGTSIRRVLDQGRWQEPFSWPSWACRRLSALTGHRIGARMPRHAPAIVAQEMLPPETFASLFKFAAVRNPWDRLVSAYAHFCRERQDILQLYKIDSFACFARWLLTSPAELQRRSALLRAVQRPQIESLVGLHGQWIVDFVARYERLEQDFHQVTERLGLGSPPLPHERQGERPDDYRTHYDDALAERVGEHYRDDVQAFDYHFDGATVASHRCKPTLRVFYSKRRPAESPETRLPRPCGKWEATG